MVPSQTRPTEKQFTLRGASSCTRRCSVRLAPIAENSSLLPPVGVWAVLNPSVADHPLRSATDRRLGRPLPHQRANQTQAHPEAACAFRHSFMRTRSTSGISASFEALFPTSGQVAYVLLNRSPLARRPKPPRSLDLHTLGTPQAFVLSQDQTLQRKVAPPLLPLAKKK